MHLSSGSILKVVLFCFAVGIKAKDAEENADHDDSLDLLKPGPATVYMFTEHNKCNNATRQKQTTFETDRCYNMDPFFIKEFTFVAQPVCKNGTVAEYTAFEKNN